MVAHKTVVPERAAPYSDLSAWLVEANYRELGCAWNSPRVMRLMAKFGDTARVMAARMRIQPADFNRRMALDAWTKQDELILSILEREIDYLRGMPPAAPLVKLEAAP